MKILLISANTEQMNMPVLPLGTACIAAAAQNAGHEVSTLNLMAQQLDIRTLLEQAVSDLSPDVIGISVRNIDDQAMENPKFLLKPVKDLVAECRHLSGAPIVLGGAGYSIFPKSVLAYLNADMGIQGEGEKAFVMLLERLEQKADISDVPGLWLPNAGCRKNVSPSKSLDDYAPPLPNVHLSLPSGLKDQEIFMPFQTRRGCPMDCSYCSTPTIEGRIMRKLPPERAVSLLCQYADAGFTRFFFVDNTFNFPASYAEALCERIIASGINISWRCILYPYNVTEKLTEKMAKAGCREVSLGCESGSAEILAGMNKKFRPEDVRRISKMLKKQRIRQMGFLLLGGPGETKESVEESLDFMDDLDLEAVKITGGIRIYPHTRLADIAVRESRITADDDLLFPKFYMTEGLGEWLKEVIAGRTKERPHWIIRS